MAKDSKTGGPTVALLMAYPQKTGWAALVDKGSFLFPTYRSLLLPDPLLLLALLSLLKSPPCSQRCYSLRGQLLRSAEITGKALSFHFDQKVSLKTNSAGSQEASANLILQKCVIEA